MLSQHRKHAQQLQLDANLFFVEVRVIQTANDVLDTMPFNSYRPSLSAILIYEEYPGWSGRSWMQATMVSLASFS